ncbi:unnamed protein product [Mucor hiemalis]
MPFEKRDLNQSYCALEDTQQIYYSASHGDSGEKSFHHNQTECSGGYFTLFPDDTNNDYIQYCEQTKTKKIYDNSVFQFDSLVFSTPEEEKTPVYLPCGWTIAGRKRSIFEMETNIHTLGELYSTLIELKNQLPPEELEKNEEDQALDPSALLSRRSSSFAMSDNLTELSSRRSSSNFSLSSSSSPLNENDLYLALTSTYPSFIFDSLIDLGISSCCCSYLHRKNARKAIQIDKIDKSYACAIFAFAALHAILCHSEKYGIYSFLNSLATDAYHTAYELLEFDKTSSTTVETLVLMYQYLLLLGNEGEARNLFCLAWRHMEIEKGSNHHQHLLLWMAELDWIYCLARDCTPVIDPNNITKRSLKVTHISAGDIMMEDISLLYRIKVFLYKRNFSNVYNTEDRLALRLHALFFSGMLQFYQQQMMVAFKFEEEDLNSEWTDYFSSTTVKTKTQVEKSLRSCMNAAYGFVQVIKLMLDEGDICELPFLADTLSTAYTVLYFGSKVTLKAPPQDTLLFIVQYLSNSSMIQCVRVHRFVQTWGSLL